MGEREDLIRFDEVFYSIKKYRRFVLFLTVLGLVVGIVLQIVTTITDFSGRKCIATASIAVVSQTQNGNFSNNNKSPNYQEVQLAEDLVGSVKYICTSYDTLQKVTDNLELLGISPKKLQKSLTVSQYEDTQIMELVLTWDDEDEAIIILNSLINIVPDALINSLKLGSVTVINSARITGSTAKQFTSKWILILGGIGFLISIGLIILQLILYPTLLDVKEVPQLFGLQCFGEIPENKGLPRNKLMTSGNQKLQERFSRYNESMTSTAVILSHVLDTNNQKYIYFTSSLENEGKTSVVSNLALRLSMIGKKVLLIDFDLRNPNMGGMFLDKTEHSHSLNAVYYNEKYLNEAVVHINENMDLLPTLLESKKIIVDKYLCNLIKESTSEYDYVLMDTGPVGLVSETMLLNRIANKAIFIIRYDKVSVEVIRNNIERLTDSGVNVIGCIVNGVTKKLDSDSYYYYYKSNDKRTHSKNGRKENQKKHLFNLFKKLK